MYHRMLVPLDGSELAEVVFTYAKELAGRLDIDVKTIKHNIDNGLLTPRHPDVVKAEKDLRFKEELLRQREAQLDELWHNRPQNEAGGPITVTGDNQCVLMNRLQPVSMLGVHDPQIAEFR